MIVVSTTFCLNVSLIGFHTVISKRAREILRRTAVLDIAPLSDEELIGQAEELFLKLDEAEAADAEKS